MTYVYVQLYIDTSHSAKDVTGYSIFSMVRQFDRNIGFYWSCTLLLKPPVLMHVSICTYSTTHGKYTVLDSFPGSIPAHTTAWE